MKIRTGFVGNSSTNSFVCVHCGRIDGGWDADPLEKDFVSCGLWHYVCRGHLDLKKISTAQKLEMLEGNPRINNIARDEEKEPGITAKIFARAWDGDEVYHIPETLCTVCQLQDFIPGELLKYIDIHVMGLEKIKRKIREMCKDYGAFLKAMNALPVTQYEG